MTSDAVSTPDPAYSAGQQAPRIDDFWTVLVGSVDAGILRRSDAFEPSGRFANSPSRRPLRFRADRAAAIAPGTAARDRRLLQYLGADPRVQSRRIVAPAVSARSLRIVDLTVRA